MLWSNRVTGREITGLKEEMSQKERCLWSLLEGWLLHPSRAKGSPEFLFYALPGSHLALWIKRDFFSNISLQGLTKLLRDFSVIK